MTDQKPIAPVISPKLKNMSKHTVPFLWGAPHVVDGYLSLEITERNIKHVAIGKHPIEVALWYEGIGLIMTGMEGKWDPKVEEPALLTFNIELQLFGLSVSSAKAGLDMILAGYYSVAFAAIRHIIESAAQAMYLNLNHDYRVNWEVGEKTERMRIVVNEIKVGLKAIGRSNDDAETFEALYTSWALMSKGSHPSGEGLLQVRPQGDDPRHIMGAAYNENLAYFGFDHGLTALVGILDILKAIGRVSESWLEQYSLWRQKRRAWIDTIRARDDLRYLWEEKAAAIQELESEE